MPDKWFISDSHLASGGKEDDFVPNLEGFRCFLADYLKAGDILVIIGDGADVKPTGQACATAIGVANADILGHILRRVSRLVWVLGNHDCFSPAVMTVLETAAIKSGCQDTFKRALAEGRIYTTGSYYTDGFYMIHGHQVDPIISRHPVLAAIVTRVGGWIERKFWPDVDVWFEKVEKWVQRIGRHGTPVEYFPAMLGYVKENLVDSTTVFYGFLFGHTHSYKNDVMEGKTIVNTGSWVGKGEHPVFQMTEDGRQLAALVFSDGKMIRREILWTVNCPSLEGGGVSAPEHL